MRRNIFQKKESRPISTETTRPAGLRLVSIRPRDDSGRLTADRELDRTLVARYGVTAEEIDHNNGGRVCAFHGLFAPGETPPAEGLQVEHFIPKTVGGTDNPRNLGWACEECNKAKGDSLEVTTPTGRRVSLVRAGVSMGNPDAIAYHRAVSAEGRALLAEIDTAFRTFTLHDAGWGYLPWALWCLLAQPAFRDRLDHLPIMVLTSNTPGSGKSSVLGVMGGLVPTALSTNGVSNPTAIGRAYRDGRLSAVVLDEQQSNVIQSGTAMHRFLNSTHAPGGGQLLNALGGDEQWGSEDLDYFLPVVVGGLRLALADDTEERAIWARLRKVQGANVAKIHADDRAELAALGARAERWAEKAAPLLTEEPPTLAFADQRRRDTWESHYRVSALLGGNVVERLNAAAAQCERERERMAPDDEAEALAAALFHRDDAEGTDPQDRGIYFHEADHDAEWIGSEDLARELRRADPETWEELNARNLADRLRPLGVAPIQRRHGAARVRGYRWADLRDALAPLLETTQEANGRTLTDSNGHRMQLRGSDDLRTLLAAMVSTRDT